MSKLLQILLGLNIFICIICASITLTLNAGFLYDADIKEYELEQTTGMTYEEIRAEYDAMIAYNNIGGSERLEFPTFAMSDTGRYHFEQVRVVFHAVEYVLIITAAISVLGIVLSAKHRKYLYQLFTFIFSVGIPGIIGLIAAVDWWAFFENFHYLVFGNEYWLFYEDTDPVITILPDGYFGHCLVMIIGITIAAAVVFLLLYFRNRKKAA